MRRRHWLIVGAGILLAGGAAAVLLAGDDGSDDPGGEVGPGSRTPPPTVDVGVPTSRAVTSTSTSEPSGSGAPLGAIEVEATRIADLDRPVAMASRAGDTTLYVAEQGGRVVALPDGGAGSERTLLDLSGEVSDGTEQGLLGLAFSPDGDLLYVDFTDRDGATRIEEFTMASDGPDPDRRRLVLSVAQPFSNHNGGHLAFGPDGHLYISLGDGGSGGDPDANAQNLGSLLGSILRIHPRPTGGSPYAVPSDNPFVGRDDARSEIWAYGLRNPWRFSFDRRTGDLWIGDVGQNAVEEIDFEPAGDPGGRNYGWDRLEGSRPFEGAPPADHVLPIHEYSHSSGGCAVTGGYVYRGSAIPSLQGAYVYSDFCLGSLEAIRQVGGQTVETAPLGIEIPAVGSFGEDADGELYVLSREGGVFRLDPR